MKIFLMRTSQFDEEKFNDICKILGSGRGDAEIEFIGLPEIEDEYITALIPTFTDGMPLCFDNLFEICRHQRFVIKQHLFKEISPNDFIVLITNIPNTGNWFSATKDNNIFVHSESFVQNTDRDEKFGIAQDILANFFQALVGENYKTNPSKLAHAKTTGCLNDFCGNKSEIIVKSRMGYICDDCIDVAIGQGVPAKTLIHIHSLLQSIREEFMNLKRIRTHLTTEISIKINSEGDFYVGGAILKLTALEKTLYYLYLTNPDGYEASSLDNIEMANKLFAFYMIFNKVAVDTPIKRMCYNPKLNESSYSRTKNSIHTKLEKSVGNILSGYYKIETYSNQKNARICRIATNTTNIIIDKEFQNKIMQSEQSLVNSEKRIKSLDIR